MHVIYRLFVFILGLIGAAEALGINVFYSASTRFQDLVGLHPDASHGFIGVAVIIVAFLGAVISLSQRLILYGGILLVLAGIVFFFIVNWWALLASPQMILAGFFAIYYWYDYQHDRMLHRIGQPSAAA